ncbi:MAG TPA: glutamate synthase [Chlorobaculum parvum]|uniref:Glutamate synthase n=1 Tax=Chlorobaculum parvum TaxID=274539 RepID=A0A7C5DF84_9CHLB|nr:glutamate synthase [Chlorobaculum parvum]
MSHSASPKQLKVATWSELKDRKPHYALVGEVDLVVIRYGDEVSVLYGRCLHRGALMADGFVQGDNLICGVHNWDYRLDSGVSEYNNEEALPRFRTWIDREANAVLVDENEIAEWARSNPQPYDRDAYQGLYADIHGGPEEPRNSYIHQLAETDPDTFSPQGAVSAMGVPGDQLPKWDDIQILTAQLAVQPLDDGAHVGTEVVIGPRAKRPLRLEIPLLVTDMSYGALSREVKIALARGAEMAGAGICSGEGGMLEAERAENSRYFYELAPAEFGFDIEQVTLCQAFHFKAGQAAKTGVGGLLPAEKVIEEIARVRGLEPHRDAHAPSHFRNLRIPEEFAERAECIREATGGIPIGFKLSAQHIEADLDFAIEAGADYVILDGRGGGTGASPDLLKNNISVPTIPALARARRHLDNCAARHVSFVITGGLRTESDFIKALALGADAIALGNAAIQAAGCLGMRACSNNHCPVGVATQDPELRQRLQIDHAAQRVYRFLCNSVTMMQVMARACGHNHLNRFTASDLVAGSGKKI